MGKRRRKNRTHLKGPQQGEEEENVPKSFVIKSGDVTKSVSQLVKDMRQVMEPYTASRLRERPGARLRDYLMIAPTLAVTHLMAFTLTDAANVHLRMARLPQGPTLTFRIERYSLMRDLINSALRNVGKAPGSEYRSPPLLVLNNFNQQPDQPVLPQLKLMSTMFQGLFPAISVERSALVTFRRVLLISYNPQTNLISFRHYTISVRSHGVSRRIKKLVSSTTLNPNKLPNLSNKDDIADYLLRRVGTPGTDITEPTSQGSTVGYESGSETDMSEAESDTNAVELPDDYGRNHKKGDRKAVRLVEIGPRLEMRLIKVTDGLVGSKKGEGETVFHEFVHKSKVEATNLKKTHEERRKLKDARRAEQAANVARKKAEKEEKKKNKKMAKIAVGEDGDEGEGSEEDDEDEDEEVDVEGLSDLDVDPDEVLRKRREKNEGKQKRKSTENGIKSEEEEDEEGDDFAYEDEGMDGEGDEDDDDDQWDEDVGAGDVSEESESEEEQEIPVKRVKSRF